MTTPPNHALQRFEVAGSHREGFTGGKGLVNNQTESAGADEPTVPRRERRGGHRCVPGRPCACPAPRPPDRLRFPVAEPGRVYLNFTADSGGRPQPACG